MIKRLLTGLFLAVLLLPAFLLACSGAEKETDMVVTTTIPAIDVIATTGTETATFSLG